MFLFWLAFLLPSIQLENIIMALGMKHYEVSCVSISIIILLSVGLLVERREYVRRGKKLCVNLADSIVSLVNYFYFFPER